MVVNVALTTFGAIANCELRIALSLVFEQTWNLFARPNSCPFCFSVRPQSSGSLKSRNERQLSFARVIEVSSVDKFIFGDMLLEWMPSAAARVGNRARHALLHINVSETADTFGALMQCSVQDNSVEVVTQLAAASGSPANPAAARSLGRQISGCERHRKNFFGLEQRWHGSAAASKICEQVCQTCCPDSSASSLQAS